MKKIILLTLTILMMVGCDNKTDAKKIEANRLNGFNIVVIDSCEYLIRVKSTSYCGFGYLAHKGNCKFCAERRKQELEALAERTKEN